jgi:hypothetical protein
MKLLFSFPLALFAFGVIISPAWSNDNLEQACVNIYRGNVSNVLVDYSGYEKNSDFLNDICEEYNYLSSKSTEKSGGATVPIPKFPISAKGKFSELEVLQIGRVYCEKTTNKEDLSTVLQNLRIFPNVGAMTAFNSCLSLANRNIRIEIVPSENDAQISITLTAMAGVSMEFSGPLTISPPEAFACTNSLSEIKAGDKLGGDGLGSDSRSMICTRKIKTAGTLVSADSAQILIPLSYGAVVYSVSELNYETIELKKAAEMVEYFGLPDGIVASFNLEECPKGWVPANGKNGTVDVRDRFILGLSEADEHARTVGLSHGYNEISIIASVGGKAANPREAGWFMTGTGLILRDSKTGAFHRSRSGWNGEEFVDSKASDSIPIYPRYVVLRTCEKRAGQPSFTQQ